MGFPECAHRASGRSCSIGLATRSATVRSSSGVWAPSVISTPSLSRPWLSLRRSLIAEADSVSTGDIMRIDAAVLAYYSMIRVQGWIGNLSLVFERELFGQAPLNEFHGEETAKRITELLSRLAETMMPLLERSNRMMVRSLSSLRQP